MATKNDLSIDQGTTFSTVINLVDNSNNPLNLTGYIAASQMKRAFTSQVAIPFVATVNATGGTVTLSMAANVTSVISGRYVYDISLTDASNNITRIVEGVIVVNPGVTNITVETTANTYNANTDYVIIPLNT